MSQIEQAQKLLSELEPYLKKINQDIADAERRSAVAKNQADNMEDRNRRVMEGIEKEAEAKKKLLVDEGKKQKVILDSEIATAEVVKKALLDEITVLNDKKTKLSERNDISATEEAEIKTQVTAYKTELVELDNQIVSKREEVTGLQAKAESLVAQIDELKDSQQHANEDLEVLNNEVEVVEYKVIELDAQFKARKETLEAQLKDIQLKLKAASESLLEAQNQDKQTREALAEEHIKLDKRTQAVRRMEAKLSDAESRIEELQRYDVL